MRESCYHYKILSSKLEEVLKYYSMNQIIDRDLFNEIAQRVEYGESNVIEGPCMKCSSCYEYDYYSKLFMETFVDENKDIIELKKDLQNYEKIKWNDRCFDSSPKIKSKIHFDTENIINDRDKEVVYFDQNIFINYVDNREFMQKINKSKNKYYYCFSPGHLHEIIKLEDANRKYIFFDKLMELTNNLGVYNIQNKLDLIKYMNIEYIYEQEQDLIKAIKVAEEGRLIQANDANIFFEKYREDNHLRRINNCKLEDIHSSELQELLTHVICEYDIDYIKHDKVRTYSLLNHLVYSLYDVLNLLGYRKDNKEKTIKSSIHDIEHIGYASICDIFVSNDTKLNARVKEIYKFLNIKTKVMDGKEFVKLLE